VPPTALVGETDELRIGREAAFAPLLAVTPTAGDADAVARHNACPFGLSAAVFSRDVAAARELAAKLRTGSVVVNDVIVPTAHPGTPFGGRGASGWGVTQGAEGLLAMTAVQVVTTRSGTFRPHVDSHLARDGSAAAVAGGMLRLLHGRGVGGRLRGVGQLIRGLRRARFPGS
jgi:aldehyde dehydrogenase (NAD+)